MAMDANLESAGSGGRLSETKRTAIIKAARQLFLEFGFNAVSMDAIAELAGVSKRTVYSHFTDKQTLFGAVMEGACSEVGVDFSKADLDAPPEQFLLQLGQSFALLVNSPLAIAIHRVVLAEAPRHPELAQVFHQTGCLTFSAHLARYLARQNELGRLVVDDPEAAALEFYELMQGPYHNQLLLDVIPQPSAEEIKKTVNRKVAGFIRTYQLQP